jgi:hypothetical protein
MVHLFTQHVRSLVLIPTLSAGWTETQTATSRFPKIAQKLLSKDLIKAILESSLMCPLAMLQAPIALYSLVRHTPSAAKMLVEFGAISWLAQLSHPGCIEHLLSNVMLPEYALYILHDDFTNVYPTRTWDLLPETDAIARLFARIPVTRECAAEVLAIISTQEKDCVSALYRNERLQASLLHWLRNPCLDRSEGATIHSFAKILANFCNSSALFDKMLDAFDLGALLMYGCYSAYPNVVDEHLRCVRSAFGHSARAQQTVLENQATVEALFIHLFSTCEPSAKLAAESVKLLMRSDAFSGLLPKLLDTGFISPFLAFSLTYHRVGEFQSLGRQLLEQLDLHTPNVLGAVHEVAVAKKSTQDLAAQADALITEKRYADAAALYTQCIEAHMVRDALDVSELRCVLFQRGLCLHNAGQLTAAVRDLSLSAYLEFSDPLDRGDAAAEQRVAFISKVYKFRAVVFCSLGELQAAFSDHIRAASVDEYSALSLAPVCRHYERVCGLRLVCSSCNRLSRTLRVCACDAVAYCGPLCDTLHTQLHKDISPACTAAGKVWAAGTETSTPAAAPSS